MKKRMPAFIGFFIILVIWQMVVSLEIVPSFMLPSPVAVIKTFISEWPVLFSYAKITLLEAFLGIGTSFILAFFVSLFMLHDFFYSMLYPLLVLSQTIPVVAIAPLLVLWFGYGLLPKIMLIVLVCFFPLTIALIDGYRLVDIRIIQLIRSFGGNFVDVFTHAFWPSSLPNLFSGLKIAISYGVVGAVIAEWLGGAGGLGAYMTQVRKAYAYDKMFASILFISIISMLLYGFITIVEKKILLWQKV